VPSAEQMQEAPLPLESSTDRAQEQGDCLSPSKEEELRSRLSQVEARLATVQEQLTHLALSLLQQRDRQDARQVADLPPLIQQAEAPNPSSPEQKGGARSQVQDAQPPAGSCPHPAEKRRRPLLPLVEYGACGLSVVICPQIGELHLIPDSPEWFAWLASLASFRFIGKQGRLSAYRGYDEHGPTRSRVSLSLHPPAQLQAPAGHRLPT
jgi:hypothetical protein